MIHHHSPRNIYESHHRIIMSNVDSSGYDSDMRKSPSSTMMNSSMASDSSYHGTIQATICFDINDEKSEMHKNYYTTNIPDHKIMDNFPHSSSGQQMKMLSTSNNEEPSSSIPDLEFDGTSVLCRVCGDKASGFHYGVHSCEGCKGFFRRSIQQKIQYRPCTKNQQCMIQRVNRNRCQYCRLKKCIAVGMSRDAVRFGRVPKREKARIEAAMQQSTRNRALSSNAWTDLEDLQHVIDSVVKAHLETCEFTRERVKEMKMKAKETCNYTEPSRACPLNPAPEIQSEQEFSQRFSDVIRGVIEFAGKIPGFDLLAQNDKFTLLKAGLFDALFVRLIGLFDTSIDSIICLNGQLMKRDSIQNGANARFLVDSTFKFAERMNSMQLTDIEIALFCAVVLIAPDRHGIRNLELINHMHSKLKQCLHHVIVNQRPNQPDFMNNLMNTIGDLKTLSTLHTEKLVVFRNELNNQINLDQLNNSNSYEVTTSTGENNKSDNYHNEDIKRCPYSSHMEKIMSSESVTVITSTEQSHHPVSACNVEQSPILLAKLQGCPLEYHKRRSPAIVHTSNSCNSKNSDAQYPETLMHPNIPAGTTITAVTAIPRTVQTICRKLDSPTDSGIESGSDGSSIGKMGSGSSSCSSPRSSLEEPNVLSLAESLPTLKRALEKPAIFDPHMYHKKFRRCVAPHDNLDVRNTNSHLHNILTSNMGRNNNGNLAVTHSILAGTLKTAPKMSDEHRKNQEIINRYIDQESVLKTCGSSASSINGKETVPSSPNSSTSIDFSPASSCAPAPLNLSKKHVQTPNCNNGSIVEL